MKLESYWRFRGILLIFSYILVVSTGYILLISICPMLKAWKNEKYSKLAVLYLQIYLKITLGGLHFVLEFSAVDSE